MKWRGILAVVAADSLAWLVTAALLLFVAVPGAVLINVLPGWWGVAGFVAWIVALLAFAGWIERAMRGGDWSRGDQPHDW